MKKLLDWPIALITATVSLAAMCAFDFVLSLVYYFLGMVPFLSDIIDYVGNILDLGLTSLFAAFLTVSVWSLGLTLIQKINGTTTKFENSSVFYVNFLFLFLFLAAFIFLGYQFIMLVGGTVTSYTADHQGFAKVLLFFKAIKDTISFVCSEHIILYKIGSNSFFLSVINIFANHFIDQ